MKLNYETTVFKFFFVKLALEPHNFSFLKWIRSRNRINMLRLCNMIYNNYRKEHRSWWNARQKPKVKYRIKKLFDKMLFWNPYMFVSVMYCTVQWLFFFLTTKLLICELWRRFCIRILRSGSKNFSTTNYIFTEEESSVEKHISVGGFRHCTL
jgi:hypothetical protein